MASTVPVFNDGDLPAQDCTPAVSTGKEARVRCLNWEWEDEMEEEEVVPRKVIYFRGWDREPLVVEEEEISPEQQYEKHCAYVKAVLEELALLHFRTMSEEALGDDERKTQSKKRSFEVMADATTNNNVDDDHFSQPQEITKDVGSNPPLAVK